MKKLLVLGNAMLLVGCSYGDTTGSDKDTDTIAPVETKKPKEVWVTHQTPDSTVSVVEFPSGDVLNTVTLPEGTEGHLTTFGPTAKYAYVSGMGDGTIRIIDANTKELVHTMAFAPKLTHQAKVAPDGSNMLVSVIASQKIHKVNVDEENGAWSDTGQYVSSTAFGPVRPICAIYTPDSTKAYVSMLPTGIGVLDVTNMQWSGHIATDGFVACGMIKANDAADHAMVGSSGSGGHITRLDFATDTLEDLGTVGAGDWHTWINDPEETIGFATAPATNSVWAVDLTTNPVTPLEEFVFDKVPGVPDQPDALGGGHPIIDGTMAITLRGAGKVVMFDTVEMVEKATITLAPPIAVGYSPPATCVGCALHGSTIRPSF